MKKKKIVIIVLVVLLCLAVVGGIVFASVKLIDKANSEKKEREAKEKEIIDNFEDFKEAISDFNIEWSTYNSIIEPDINKNTVYQYDGWILSLDSYKEAVDKVEKASEVYKKNCINQYYVNQDVKNKCEAWIDAYEKAINSFVKDVEAFNEKIEEINEKEEKALEKYEITYQLVDTNNDSTYSEVEIKEETSKVE